VLHTLIGYSDQPSYLQVLAYCLTLAAIFGLSKAFAPARRLPPATNSASNPAATV
jgi:high-affinity iron transporter